MTGGVLYARLKALSHIVLAAAITVSGSAERQSVAQQAQDHHSADHRPAKERLIGAWHLDNMKSTGADGKPVVIPQPQGMLIYTRDGHVSVQLMYPKSANTLSNEYVRNGYEASFGSYDVNEASHTLTHHVQGSITGDLLIGKDLPRLYQFTDDGHLVIKSARPDEHWSVTWQHD